MNVELEHAMLCWNPDTNEAKIVRHPDYRGDSAPYQMSSCACEIGRWPDWSREERLLFLYIEAWQAVVRDGISADVMHKALIAIPEFCDTLGGDVEGSSNEGFFG